jgi:uncharacterized protein (TIGR00297 family)
LISSNYIDSYSIIATIVAFLAIVALLFVSDFVQRRFRLSQRNIRKAIHIIVGLGICLSPLFFESNLPVLVIALLFLFIDWWALRTKRFNSIHPDSNSLGTVFYPISIFILALIFWYTDQWIFITASLLMIIPDALAGLTGLRFANSFHNLLDEKKSLYGTATMFISSFILIIVASLFRNDLSIIAMLMLAFTVSLIATASELLSIRGSDNLSVPLLSGLFLYFFIYPTTGDLQNQIFIGVLLSLFISIISFYIRFLSLSGAVGTFLLGSIIFGFGGLTYTIPILAFFIVSSLLSISGKKYKKKFESSFEKTGIRDFYQVWANGLIPAIFVIISLFRSDPIIFFSYCAAVAAATADTWGTELGVFSKKPPKLITTFRSVDPGTSGAISIFGLLAAFSGSVFITIVGYYSNITYDFSNYVVFAVIFVIISGFLGSVIDSLLGATIQSQFKCKVCNKITEKNIHCNLETNLVRGSIWMNNDLVNLISISFSGILVYILLNILIHFLGFRN